MMKRLFTLFFVVLTLGVAAQDDDNLVPNGDFEAANTKSLKTFGQLD